MKPPATPLSTGWRATAGQRTAWTGPGRQRGAPEEGPQDSSRSSLREPRAWTTGTAAVSLTSHVTQPNGTTIPACVPQVTATRITSTAVTGKRDTADRRGVRGGDVRYTAATGGAPRSPRPPGRSPPHECPAALSPSVNPSLEQSQEGQRGLRGDLCHRHPTATGGSHTAAGTGLSRDPKHSLPCGTWSGRLTPCRVGGPCSGWPRGEGGGGGESEQRGSTLCRPPGGIARVSSTPKGASEAAWRSPLGDVPQAPGWHLTRVEGTQHHGRTSQLSVQTQNDRRLLWLRAG